jgi:hypothetical protein
MSTAKKQQGKPLTVPANQPALTSVNQYIKMCPALFDTLVEENKEFTLLEVVELREPERLYENTKSDIWCNHCTAQFWGCVGVQYYFVYISHQGNLYCVETMLDAAKVIENAIAAERLKLMS